MRLLDSLRRRDFIQEGGGELTLGAAGESWCERVGIDLAALRRTRRRLCRPCLDWSERRAHLAGSLGAAILDRLLALRCARREVGTRALVLSPRGLAFLDGLELRR